MQLICDCFYFLREGGEEVICWRQEKAWGKWKPSGMATWGPGVKVNQDHRELSGKTEKQVETGGLESGRCFYRLNVCVLPPHPPIHMLKP